MEIVSLIHVLYIENDTLILSPDNPSYLRCSGYHVNQSNAKSSNENRHTVPCRISLIGIHRKSEPKTKISIYLYMPVICQRKGEG